MKNKFNFIIIAFTGLIFFTGCNNSGGSRNSAADGSKAINNADAGIVTNNVNGSNPAVITNTARPSKAPDEINPESKLNIDNFNKLEQGMNYNDAAELLGSKGKVISENKESGTVMYLWSETSGSFAKVVFQNDKLIAKDSKGLR